MIKDDPDYEEIKNLQEMLCKIENSHLWSTFLEDDMPDLERRAAKQTIINRLEELLGRE